MTLAEYIADKKLTDAEFAVEVGISQPHACRLRQGTRNPSARVAKIIERVTGIPAGELMLRDRVS